MNKKKKYLILDVETANSMDDPLVYDIGFAVADNTGKIYEAYSFVISDIFFDMADIMKTAYYAKKIPLYKERIRNNETKVIDFLGARWFILQLMKKYNCKTVMAYNANFDTKALNITLRYLTKSAKRWFFPFGTEVNCIWNMACQVLYTQKKFAKEAVNNKWYSASKNLKTSAEIGKNYISNTTNFEEEHTGLSDVKIETEIFVKCVKQHKKMNRNINRMCWRIPTQFHKEFLKTAIA